MIYKIHLIFKTQTLQEAVVSAEYLYCFILSSMPRWEWAAGQAHAGTGAFPSSYCCTLWTTDGLEEFAQKQRPYLIRGSLWSRISLRVTSQALRNRPSVPMGPMPLTMLWVRRKGTISGTSKVSPFALRKKRDALSVLSIIKEYQLHLL